LQLRLMVRLNLTMAREGWLQISPLAPDRFGGLGSLAAAASGLGYVILAAGLFFLAPLLRTLLWNIPPHLGNYVGLLIYLLFALTGTFGPVYLLHRVLARRRLEMLSFFSDAFDDVHARVNVLVQKKDHHGLGDENLSRALATVDSLHRQWSALPSWPMGMDVLLKFVVTVVVPAVGYFAVQRLLAVMSR
jgi:hypothetical protein